MAQEKSALENSRRVSKEGIAAARKIGDQMIARGVTPQKMRNALKARKIRELLDYLKAEAVANSKSKVDVHESNSANPTTPDSDG